MMRSLTSILALLAIALGSSAQVDDGQEPQIIHNTFGSSRVINSHSIETIDAGDLEFRISHRFGDMFGDAGGVQTLYGLDNAADIRFAFEYGITNELMVGLGRSKGAGPITSLMDGFVKYRFLYQDDQKIPVSASIMTGMAGTYMRRSEDSTSVASFPTTAHRLSYMTQLIIAAKFFDRLSLQVMPTYVHRNYVAADDVNALLSIGGALRFRISKKIGILGEYFYNLEPSDALTRPNAQNAAGIGFEYITSGHNFILNITNARGFGAYQYVPYTTSEWGQGQFRLGFTITRNFNL